jgi:hypothetical protein
MKKRYSFIVFTIFVLYGLNHFIFERVFFFNELLSLIGFIVFIKTSFIFNGSVLRIRLFKDKISLLIYFYIALCIFQLIRSIPLKTNWYFFFRNSVIFYAVFTYYLGFFFFHEAHAYFKRIQKALFKYLVVMQVLRFELLLDRFSAAVFFPLLVKRYSLKSILFVLIFNGIYAFAFNSLTVLLITAVLFLVVALRSYKQFKVMIFTVLAVVPLIFYSLLGSFELYTFDGGSNRLFGNISAVMESNTLLAIDGNSTWRAVFWYRILIEQFPENLYGLGFGTPLLKNFNEVGQSAFGGDFDDFYVVHVIGAHNTFLTLFARLGVLFYLFIIGIYRTVMQYYYNGFYFLTKESSSFKYFWSFFVISVIGMFNLVLESPIYASVFWVFLGFVSRIIKDSNNKTYLSSL